jgi:hypothetical protein
MDSFDWWAIGGLVGFVLVLIVAISVGVAENEARHKREFAECVERTTDAVWCDEVIR